MASFPPSLASFLYGASAAAAAAAAAASATPAHSAANQSNHFDQAQWNDECSRALVAATTSSSSTDSTKSTSNSNNQPTSAGANEPDEQHQQQQGAAAALAMAMARERLASVLLLHHQQQLQQDGAHYEQQVRESVIRPLAATSERDDDETSNSSESNSNNCLASVITCGRRGEPMNHDGGDNDDEEEEEDDDAESFLDTNNNSAHMDDADFMALAGRDKQAEAVEQETALNLSLHNNQLFNTLGDQYQQLLNNNGAGQQQLMAQLRQQLNKNYPLEALQSDLTTRQQQQQRQLNLINHIHSTSFMSHPHDHEVNGAQQRAGTTSQPDLDEHHRLSALLAANSGLGLTRLQQQQQAHQQQQTQNSTRLAQHQQFGSNHQNSVTGSLNGSSSSCSSSASSSSGWSSAADSLASCSPERNNIPSPILSLSAKSSRANNQMIAQNQFNQHQLNRPLFITQQQQQHHHHQSNNSAGSLHQNHHLQQHLLNNNHHHHHHQHHPHHHSHESVHKADSEDLNRIRSFIEQFKARRGALGLTQKQAAQCFRAFTNDRYAFSDNFVGHFEGFQFRPQTAMTIADSLAEWLEFAENETRQGRQLNFMPGKVKETRKRKYEVIRIRDSAKRVLVEAFEKNRSPSTSELEQLSRKTNIPSRNIEIFFKNRRTSRQYHQ